MKFAKEDIGGRIRAIRERLKLGQQELAARLFTNNKAISSYETGRVFPPLTVLVKIAELGGVSLDWLIAGRGPGPGEGAKKAEKESLERLAEKFVEYILAEGDDAGERVAELLERYRPQAAQRLDGREARLLKAFRQLDATLQDSLLRQTELAALGLKGSRERGQPAPGEMEEES